MMKSADLYEIHGFSSLSEYQSFVQYLDSHIKLGSIKEIPVDINYCVGKIYGGRWFYHAESKSTWRLVPPDFPFKGIFEKIID